MLMAPWFVTEISFSTMDFYSGGRTEAAGEFEGANVVYAKSYLALSVAP